jgi:LmbE family N-acetylglucosaminyl deacetylase
MMRVLAVGAHPDDVEIGCGATLALLKKKRHRIHILVLTRGEASGASRIREKECAKAAQIIGANKLFLGNLKDTEVTDGIATIREIERIIDLVQPDMIFSHSQKDAHQDHRNTHLATLSAARKSKKILLYESPTAFREFHPEVFFDVTSTADRKLSAINGFNSQASKSYLESSLHQTNGSKPRRVSSAIYGLMRYRGYQVGVPLAEAFEVARYLIDV